MEEKKKTGAFFIFPVIKSLGYIRFQQKAQMQVQPKAHIRIQQKARIRNTGSTDPQRRKLMSYSDKCIVKTAEFREQER